MMSAKVVRLSLFGLVVWLGSCFVSASVDFAVLQPTAFARHIERFNAMDDEVVVNAVSNRDAWNWLRQNIPLFECPDREVDRVGSHYGRGAGFRLLANGQILGKADRAERLTGKLP